MDHDWYTETYSEMDTCDGCGHSEPGDTMKMHDGELLCRSCYSDAADNPPPEVGSPDPAYALWANE